MIPPRMLRPLKVILITSAWAAVAVLAAGCGTEKINRAFDSQLVCGSQPGE